MNIIPKKDLDELLNNDLKLWKFDENHIIRNIKTKDWLSTMMLTNMIGFLAEQHNHHPELGVTYNNIRIILTTHDAGNKITTKDLDLAKKIEENLSNLENNLILS